MVRKAVTNFFRKELFGLQRKFAMAVGLSKRDYSDWLLCHDTLSARNRAKMRQIADGFGP